MLLLTEKILDIVFFDNSIFCICLLHITANIKIIINVRIKNCKIIFMLNRKMHARRQCLNARFKFMCTLTIFITVLFMTFYDWDIETISTIFCTSKKYYYAWIRISKCSSQPPTEREIWYKNKFSFCIYFEVENHALIFEIPDRMSAFLHAYVDSTHRIYESEEEIYNFWQ